MKRLIALAVLSAFVGSTIAQQPCASVNDGAVTPKIPLPLLPTSQFKSVVRAEIVNKKMTVEATEYVDEKVNMAAVKVVQNGTNALILMSYPTNEVFYMIPSKNVPLIQIAGPMACEKKTLSADDNTQLFGMRFDPTSKYPHLYSTSKILNFINGTEVYKGRSTIGGVPVNRWSSCVYWSQLRANFTLDYYFTVPGWQTPSGLDQIPVRAEITGMSIAPNHTSHNFHHIYQYVNFENYVNDPETVFSTPPGVYCEDRNSTKPVPKIARHFYYREEISSPPSTGYTLLQETDIWYDYDLELIRFDSRLPPQELSGSFTWSTGPFSTIHDYSVGVQYAIARDLGTCLITPIPTDARGFDASYNISRQHLGLRSPMHFFNLDEAGYVYAGKRTARGQQCDVFQNMLSNIAGHGIVVYEVYFLSGGADVTDRGDSGDSLSTVVPMRVMMWEKGQLVDQYEIHDYDQDSPSSNNFDVTPCYPGKESIDFELFMTVADTNLMPQVAPYLKELLELDVAFSTGISPVRLQKSRLHWNRWAVYYRATMLDTAPPLAKYEQTVGKSMASGLGKAIPNIYGDVACASLCDTLEEWNCVQFDYCNSTRVCTLGRFTNVSTLIASSSCIHYRRVLGGRYDSQESLSDAWTKLKNNVFGKKLVIELALPDANGKVDISVDTSKLDKDQKLSFTGVYITNQVVANVNRNPASGNVMNNFHVMPNKVGKDSTTTLRGLSVDDCASSCVGELTYDCQSFHYCWDAGYCFLSKLHPDERPDMLRDSSTCDLYYRDYTTNFQKYAGVTVLSGSNTIYQDVTSASQCAKLCTHYSAFRCESFDFCTDVNACFLGRTHYYDVPKANIKQQPSCTHYSRDYVQDFVVMAHKQVKMLDNRVVQDVTAAQCAKLCVKEGSFTCNSFDYCGNFTECRLSDAMVSKVGQVTLEPTAYCDVYIRQYGTSPTQAPTAKPGTPGGNNHNNTPRPNVTPKPNGNNHNNTPRPNVTPKPNGNPGGSSGGNIQAQTGSGGGSSGYTGGAMGGLAIAMIIVGLILGVGGIMLYIKLYGRRPGDDMTVAFSKQMDTVST